MAQCATQSPAKCPIVKIGVGIGLLAVLAYFLKGKCCAK